jgi:hypothetical protein
LNFDPAFFFENSLPQVAQVVNLRGFNLRKSQVNNLRYVPRRRTNPVSKTTRQEQARFFLRSGVKAFAAATAARHNAALLSAEVQPCEN